MKLTPTKLKGAFLLQPKVFNDPRGFFLESYNAQIIQTELNVQDEFVQDNQSRSTQGVLRGMHYQIRQPQGKLVRVVRGCIFDVIVDLRKTSSTFGQWDGVELSEDNHTQLWIPPGFAHGFIVLSNTADFLYKTTDYYAPEHERCLKWDDPTVGIKWPLSSQPIISEKDALGRSWNEIEKFDI